jgi:hypothetical protein
MGFDSCHVPVYVHSGNTTSPLHTFSHIHHIYLLDGCHNGFQLVVFAQGLFGSKHDIGSHPRSRPVNQIVFGPFW